MTEQKPEQNTIKDRAKRKLERDMGPELLAALHDPKTVEIMLNADGKLWQERLGEPMRCIGTLRVAQAQAIIETDCRLPRQGSHTTAARSWKASSRLTARASPASSPRSCLRRPLPSARRRSPSSPLTQYVERGIMTAQQREALADAVAAHRNILVIGGTGSGKTTLVNAIINEMVMHDPIERVFIIEDTGEIQCAAENYVQYHTSIDVTMTALLKTTLRMRPDRILVGEVRGPEALICLMAWNTGHEGGAATLHANNATAGLIGSPCSSACTRTPPKPIEPLIGEAVHVVVHIARTPDGSRRIQEILEVSGYADGQYITKHCIPLRSYYQCNHSSRPAVSTPAHAVLPGRGCCHPGVLSAGCRSTLSPPKAPAARCPMKAG